VLEEQVQCAMEPRERTTTKTSSPRETEPAATFKLKDELKLPPTQEYQKV